MKIKIGIIGGMGPMATVEFLRTLTDATDAKTDQEHVNYILYNVPEIPSRIDAFFHGGETPVNEINNGIKFLAANGIEKIAIPCNTAHIWYDEFIEQDKLLNMVALTVKNIIKMGLHHPGFIATTATIDSGLYINDMKKKGIVPVIPENEELVMEAVGLVKEGKIQEGREMIMPVAREFEKEGCDSIIMACTEIPVILKSKDTELPLINSDRILAEAIIREAGKDVRY
ncbi:MAG: amino acid racemase [Ferroplasma sp.]